MKTKIFDEYINIIKMELETPIEQELSTKKSNEIVISPIKLLSDYVKENETNKIIETYNCDDCKGNDSIKNINGTFICVECGILKGLDMNDDFECQYSGMANNDNSVPNRTGLMNNNLLFHSNFSTKISGSKISSNIKQINNVWDGMISKERTLLKIFKDITEKCRMNGLPNNVINYSHVLYKSVFEKQKQLKDGSRADKLKGLIAACIYYSCKSHNINRSHMEIAEICDTSKTNVSTGCKTFFKLMNNELNLNKNATECDDFLERYCNSLELLETEQKIIKELSKNVTNLELLGDNKPWTIASVCIYFVSTIYNFEIDRKEIAEKCGTTETTLKKFHTILLNHVEDIIV